MSHHLFERVLRKYLSSKIICSIQSKLETLQSKVPHLLLFFVHKRNCIVLIAEVRNFVTFVLYIYRWILRKFVQSIFMSKKLSEYFKTCWFALCTFLCSELCLLSHAHTVVWECCKDDQQSQWEMLKFDLQLPLNPLSDRHQIWRAWLRHGYLSPRKNWAQSVKGFLLPIYAKYTPPCSLRYTTLPYTHVYYFFLVLPIAYSRDPCMDFNA